MPLLPIVKMTRTVMKSLFGGSACRMYPKRPPRYFTNSRGRLEIDPAKCILCSLCARTCPTDAIEVNREEKSWEIDRLRCIVCGLCVEKCPKKCLRLLNEYTPPVTGETKELFRVEPPAKGGAGKKP